MICIINIKRLLIVCQLGKGLFSFLMPMYIKQPPKSKLTTGAMANPINATKLIRAAGRWLLGTNIKYKDAMKHKLQMTANLDRKAIKRLTNGIYF